ncbi:hypothetical protein K7X08_002868 [Anisodus acutangulus]|uniref:Uncharacterized protein n=1 Tax=Anisodus acutangulus TaxID=402998 RepID=A0A9Q1MD06_9SOLA|nr:hypothetical protein K7X08_002868 [Anisodus acutangulus]
MEFVLGLIHKILGTYLPHMATTTLIHFMPLYLILNYIISENVADKVVVITCASSGIGESDSFQFFVHRCWTPKYIIHAPVNKVWTYPFFTVTNAAPSMDINFWGAVYTTHFAIPLLKEKGNIIALSSIAGLVAAPRLNFYNASKAAMISFFETLRVELGTQFGITIVTPGLIESELTKGKFLTIEGKLKVDQVIRDVS